MENYLGLKTETKFGINTLELMLLFIKVFESKTNLEIEVNWNKLRKFISEKIGRELIGSEHLDLAESTLIYLKSEPETELRSNIMQYLFNLDFIKDDNTQR